MKKIPLLVILVSLALPMQASIMQVTGSFSGAPKSGVNTRLLSGGFTAYFDSSLVAATGNFTFDNLTPTSFFLNNPLVGGTIFDLTNTYLDLGFSNGSLTSFTLGDINNNTTTSGTDDFSVYFENNGSFLLSQVVLSEKGSGFYGSDFRFNDPSAGSFSVTVAPSVPETASTLLLTLMGGLGLLAVRRCLALPGKCCV